MHHRFLYHDFLVRGNECNLRCTYCTSTADAGDYGEATTPELARPVGRRIHIGDTLAIFDAFREHSTAPLLKISGGEIFVYKNAIELLAELAERYHYVQVLTNGTALNRAKLEAIARLEKVGINLSLDGHHHGMNRFRWPSEKLTEYVVSGLETVLDTLGECEITTVVTDANATDFGEFLDHLQGLEGRVVVVPIPVRGTLAAEHFSPESRLLFAERIVEWAEAFPATLAPKSYCEHLGRFLRDPAGRRRSRCHLVKVAVQVFDTGAITPCPVGWTLELGNLRTQGAERAVAEIGRHKLYDLMTRPQPVVPVCRNCFSQADIINLFLEGKITAEEIGRVPMYSRPAVQERLAELRAGGGMIVAPSAAPEVTPAVAPALSASAQPGPAQEGGLVQIGSGGEPRGTGS